EAWSPIPLTPAKKREADCDEGLPFVCASFPVAMERGKHPFPSRTRKLSPSSPMVLHGRPGGRVGRCRSQFPRPPSADGQTPTPPRTHVLGGFSFFAAVSPPPDSEPSAGGWTEQRERGGPTNRRRAQPMRARTCRRNGCVAFAGYRSSSRASGGTRGRDLPEPR